MEIELRNVGIVRSAHLQFVQGLNLIVGASSSGKSTLFRAVRAMMDNSFSDSNISYGQRKLAIRMQYDGHSATYIRDLDNSNRKTAYQIDGKVYTKLGRTSLEDLSNLFKLSPVEIDGEKINFNFSAQFSGPFLLLGSSSLLYSILTYRSSFDITKINDLYFSDFKNTKKELDALVKTKKTLEKEKDKKEAELNSLSVVPDIYTKVQILKDKNERFTNTSCVYSLYKDSLKLQVEKKHTVMLLGVILEKYKDYNTIYNLFSTLMKFKMCKKEIRKTEKSIKKISKVILGIDSLLGLFNGVVLLNKYQDSCLKHCTCTWSIKRYENVSVYLSSLLEQYKIAYTLDSYIKTYSEKSLLMKRVSSIKSILSASSLFLLEYSKTNVLYKYNTLKKKFLSVKRNVCVLKGCLEKIEAVGNTFSVVKLLSITNDTVKRFEHNQEVLQKITYVPNTESISILQCFLLKQEEIGVVKKDLYKKESELKKVLSSIKSVGVCPLCQQPLCDCV